MWGKIKIYIIENLSGILGTVAFHLFLAIVFLLITMSSTKSGMESIIYLDFTDEPLSEEIFETTTDVNPEVIQMIEELLAETRRNIPVNVASRMDEEISTEKYLEQLEDELDGERSQEYYKQQERLNALAMAEEQADMHLEAEKDNEEVIYNYEGPTSIYYSLENRYHLRLPIPVYKCEGSGEITVTIAVDQKGRVVQVQVPEEGKSLNELCLAEAARKSAQATRFNADYNAPLRQKGTITYNFIAQ